MTDVFEEEERKKKKSLFSTIKNANIMRRITKAVEGCQKSKFISRPVTSGVGVGGRPSSVGKKSSFAGERKYSSMQ